MKIKLREEIVKCLENASRLAENKKEP